MIGDQNTGAIDGVVISAVAHEGLSVTVNGKPAKLAVVTEDGQVVVVGTEVAREARAVAVNNYRQLLKAKGHIRTIGRPMAQQHSASAA